VIATDPRRAGLAVGRVEVSCTSTVRCSSTIADGLPWCASVTSDPDGLRGLSLLAGTDLTPAPCGAERQGYPPFPESLSSNTPDTK